MSARERCQEAWFMTINGEEPMTLVKSVSRFSHEETIEAVTGS